MHLDSTLSFRRRVDTYPMHLRQLAVSINGVSTGQQEQCYVEGYKCPYIEDWRRSGTDYICA